MPAGRFGPEPPGSGGDSPARGNRTRPSPPASPGGVLSGQDLIRPICNLTRDNRQGVCRGKGDNFFNALPAWNGAGASRLGDIGVGEIAAFAQEPGAMNRGAGVGQAIAEIRPARGIGIVRPPSCDLRL